LSRKEIIRRFSEANNKAAYLFFDGSTRDVCLETQEPSVNAIIKVLSETGQTLEAASRLFEVLHELDNCNVLSIFAQLAPNENLGEAINDRLKRGAACCQDETSAYN
jgi:hypothetical protein